MQRKRRWLKSEEGWLAFTRPLSSILDSLTWMPSTTVFLFKLEPHKKGWVHSAVDKLLGSDGEPDFSCQMVSIPRIFSRGGEGASYACDTASFAVRMWSGVVISPTPRYLKVCFRRPYQPALQGRRRGLQCENARGISSLSSTIGRKRFTLIRAVWIGLEGPRIPGRGQRSVPNRA